jgi:ATP/maltotriose-dependent transcriptional regulator MalT
VRQALAVERFLDCDPVDEVAELAASQIPPPWEFRGERVLVPAFANRILAFSGRWDQSRAAVVRFTEAAYESGSLVSVSSGLGFLAQVDRLGGRLSDAEAEARTAWEIATELVSLSPYGWAALMNLLASLIARGDLEAAARLTEGFDLSAGPGEIPIDPWPIEMRGYMRLAEGDLAGAAQDLLAFGEELERWGALNPAFAPWRQEAAPALAALGRTAEGEQLIFEAEKRARRFKAPHLIGTVLRSRALLEPRKRAIETLGESVALLERSGPPHELARSLLERGAALRRDGRRSEAREPLRRALELAHRTGAGALARRAGEELAAAGSRPRSVFRIGVAALTASELRTARLAAEGLNNREIAERLFVTRRTVETHLTHVYAKLDIAGREQLQAALAADPS